MPNFSSLDFFLKKYFPGQLTETQEKQFELAFDGFVEWNAKINVVSRKDIENLAERHFLHSLAIAKLLKFKPETTILDAGTGGGFPGIPLAILFPECRFHLVDSVAKKVKVVAEIVQLTGLKNVQHNVQRVELLPDKYDFVVSRAVSTMAKFIPLARKRVLCKRIIRNDIKNGILYLRGGDVAAEMKAIPRQTGKWKTIPLTEYFEEEYFESKSLLHLSWC